ncbi:MAG: phospho-sugar mutase [Bacteroidetes bacterium]|nr:phospho-sugar mutase [Bacteroidota bacterium]MDA1119187.1 phospho-sugar mutase [Bacteroidota bacterium]
MNSGIRSTAQQWMESTIVDAKTKTEIASLLRNSDETELIDCFYKNLEFGTGGLRGIMGAGTNRINKYTIGMATQGLANYLNQNFPDEQIKVAIAHDSRNNSRFFTEVTAGVFSANGIKVYVFEELRPTPELSFAIRHLGCHSGVVVTASHNPKEYNGYKAYWNDGAQVIAPHDKNIVSEVNRIKSLSDVKFEPDTNLIVAIGKDIDEAYLACLEKLSLAPDIIKAQKDLKIVFSSIHGTGITLVPEILKRFGFENVHLVDEQAVPDGNFPTVIYPNPEEKEAMSMALKKGQELDADLIMATDPDADRVGIGVKNNHGKFQLLNGNQTGALLVYYLLEKWKANGKLTGKEFIVKTIVTTNLIEEISKGYSVKYYNTLTGFKFIAALIKKLEGKEKFIGGGEESYGYLIGDEVRDKDAIASCAMIAEMTAYAKNEGKSLFDLLMEIYCKYSLYKEDLISVTKKGKTGAEEISQMMSDLRNAPPSTLGGSEVIKLIDYKESIEKDLITRTSAPIDFPKSDVLQFITKDGSKISARPSGTEPKIKFYFSVRTSMKSKDEFDQKMGELESKIATIMKNLHL